MRYWWVNQKKTYRQEVRGSSGFLWSPKLKSNEHRNPYYEFMREVSPGDLIFSYADAKIRAVGIARSYAYECPKPEFGTAGRNWNDVGWRVEVGYRELDHELRPLEWIELLRPLLPSKHSPLRSDGLGREFYLTELPRPLALQLSSLIDTETAAYARAELIAEDIGITVSKEAAIWEEHLLQGIISNPDLASTERESLVLARRGQGLFRERVSRLESHCRVTRVDRPEHLRASHCKPWRDCKTNTERLDPGNGLMLTPSIDHLFDRGFISFESDGRLLVSPVAHLPSLQRMGVPEEGHDVGRFSTEQARYLEYHRDAVLLRSRLAG